MKYGLTETAVEKICAVFARFPAIEKAVLYGSRAKGNFKTGSDIDLTLYGEALTSDLCSAIASALDDQLLPYTIDLSVFEELNHAKLREHIERVGVLFYERAQQGAAVKKGWQAKTLGEVCVVDKCQGSHKNLPYVGLEHIESHTGRFLGSTEPVGVKSSTFKFSPEHVLYGRLRPYLNKVMVPDFTGHCSTEIFPFKPRPGLSREFLQYWFLREATVEQIDATSTGARMPRANINEVLDFEFPLPPLPEQQRIVGILDEAFAGVATAKANAEKNLQNARALFESHLHSVFTQRGKGWVERTLEDVCDQITDGKHGDCTDEESSGYYFLSAKDVKSGTLNYENARQITRADFEETHRRTNLEPGDILITNSGTIGRMAIAPSDHKTQQTTFQKSVAILKPKRMVIDSTFAFYCLSSGLSRFVNLSAGAAQKNLLLRDLRSYRFALPTVLDDQRSVAARLRALSSETQRLAGLYERKLAALEALKKSLLHQAFTGQL